MKSILRISTIGLSLMVATLTSNAQIWLPNGVSDVNTSTAGPALNGVNTTNGIPEAAFDVVGNNHLLIHPTSPLDIEGKFCAAGESGGVPGPSITGCDLYGFRAQANLSSFINMGLRRTGDVPDNIPTISFGSFDNFEFASYPKALEFRYDLGLPGGGCGNLVAQMGGIGYPFQVYGSALASGGMWINSDARFKTEVKDLNNALDVIGQLRGTTYKFKTEEFAERKFDGGTQYGFIAQELEQVLPTAVKADDQGYLGVNYNAIIPVLVEAVKEQQAEIEVQQAEIEALKAQINGTAPKNGNDGSSSLDLDEQGRLMQNNPNPFNETTVIEFFLPDNAQTAELLVYNMEGVQVIRQQVTQKGFGRINVAGGDLQAGIYIYTLVIDGTAIDSKRMILSK